MPLTTNFNSLFKFRPYQMYKSIQQDHQQPQQRPRLNQFSIQLRPNTVNREKNPQPNQQQKIRNGQYIVYFVPIQQLPQQQQKCVPMLSIDTTGETKSVHHTPYHAKSPVNAVASLYA